MPKEQARAVLPGLSPRVRGNHWTPVLAAMRSRSIPACAGEPRAARTPPYADRVYPRVCGGTLSSGTSSATAAGLSPRVRGNRNGERPHLIDGGSIPACAGEPASRQRWLNDRKVYPRVCGGTAGRSSIWRVGRGLSPRVRGNLGHFSAAGMEIVEGSIPACAGEPAGFQAVGWGWGVYPRVCGGTHCPGVTRGDDGGLSPRVRGNRRRGNAG